MAASITMHDQKQSQRKVLKKKSVRYFQESSEKEESTSIQKSEEHGEIKKLNQVAEKNAERDDSTDDRRKRSKDPFEGPAKVSPQKMKKYSRGERMGRNLEGRTAQHRFNLKRSEQRYELAAKQAARAELLLPEDAGQVLRIPISNLKQHSFLEVGEGSDTYDVRQSEITESVDIGSAAKRFELTLNQFGPYRMDYTRNGRFLALAGKMGHLTAFDWVSKQLLFEINVMETITDVQWLHVETMMAVAQKKWLYMYDNTGTELHCIKSMSSVLRMSFLPYHFLLAAATNYGALQYLDVSMGKMVSEIKTKQGRLDVMAQNPQNAVIHLGHTDVNCWQYNLCTCCVLSLFDRYMATSGIDRTIKIYDLRTYKPLQSYRVAHGANELRFSQRGLLAGASNNIVEIFKDSCTIAQDKPYMVHRLKNPISDLDFCPYEDVLGIGHSNGYSSLLVPGSGEPNFDALEVNPFMTKKQRKEAEVKSLLEKIQPELITLDPNKIGEVDRVTFQQREEDRRVLFLLLFHVGTAVSPG
ncbi:putative WD repeat-containing protein 46 isoform X2 [Apostichopus japonicus]|uniref:Putative WD repeat-containing protein 46 isoform X2 n=1 Tax=Stichopus japonicus TaxID=307972 RepID=A0A2G8L1F4_STIJA|nr:putative WD repeat-containing protein 46 isoform X2 [Apostichopus japonicus]